MGLKSAAVVAGVGLLGVAAPARADIIITQVTGPVAVSGGYAYTYDALLSFNSELTTTMPYPGFTTLYDAGVTSLYNASTGYLATADFTFTYPLSSTAAYRSLPVDNPGVTNVKITYNGKVDSTIVGSPLSVTTPGGPLQIGTNPVDLGQFTIFSIYNTQVPSSFDGQSQTAFGSASGAEQGNNSTTTVPSAVPEPASLGLIALAGTTLLARRRPA